MIEFKKSGVPFFAASADFFSDALDIAFLLWYN